MQPLDLVERDVGPGRIVRIGEEHHLRRRRYRRQHGVQIRLKISFRHLDDTTAGVNSGDEIDSKAVLRHDDVAPGPAVGQCELVQQIVGPRTADDPRRIELPAFADRRA